jgi:hypothetical protein
MKTNKTDGAESAPPTMPMKDALAAALRLSAQLDDVAASVATLRLCAPGGVLRIVDGMLMQHAATLHSR